MNGPLIIVMVAVFFILGSSIRGVFNRERSIFCLLCGGVTVVVSALGALHAWGESRSIPWTAGYLAAFLIGIVCVFRQLRQQRKE